jgi:hypothetical protein
VAPGEGAVVARARRGIFLLLKRNIETIAGREGLLAFFVRNIGFWCFVLKRIRSACGSMRVSLFRFIHSLRGEVAMPCVVELVPVVTLSDLAPIRS